MIDQNPSPVAMCPRCNRPMRAGLVRTALWAGESVYLVEDIPAQVCDSCLEQYYDEETTNALRQLAEDGFPTNEMRGEVLIPVFSLAQRTHRKVPNDFEAF